jgi:hypothetical protein
MMLKLWDIHLTDKGPDAERPRFVVRAIKKGTTFVIYGTGDSEIVARQDAYTKMMAEEYTGRKSEIND